MRVPQKGHDCVCNSNEHIQPSHHTEVLETTETIMQSKKSKALSRKIKQKQNNKDVSANEISRLEASVEPSHLAVRAGGVMC